MIVFPKVRRNICLTAHPTGCRRQIERQIDVAQAERLPRGPRHALVVGASNGYGLAGRIMAAFGASASTTGVFLEKVGRPGHPGTAGYYNDLAFQELAAQAGLSSASINGDAFEDATKAAVIEAIAARQQPVDLVLYSIAAPRRRDPESGELYSTAIKPIGGEFHSKTIDLTTGELLSVSASPATATEIEHTCRVMGGDDWRRWIAALDQAGLLARGAVTVALSYVGPELTAPIYRDGTIGRAKQHLEATARALAADYAPQHLTPLIAVNRALVTRASAVIPAVTLYMALLYQVLKARGQHEDCIAQMQRLFGQHLYSDSPGPRDAEGRIRLDDLELQADVQREVRQLFDRVTGSNVRELVQVDAFRDEFLQHHGFDLPGVDYQQEVNVCPENSHSAASEKPARTGESIAAVEG